MQNLVFIALEANRFSTESVGFNQQIRILCLKRNPLRLVTDAIVRE
jgi:hypothetical protein